MRKCPAILRDDLCRLFTVIYFDGAMISLLSFLHHCSFDITVFAFLPAYAPSDILERNQSLVPT